MCIRDSTVLGVTGQVLQTDCIAPRTAGGIGVAEGVRFDATGHIVETERIAPLSTGQIAVAECVARLPGCNVLEAECIGPYTKGGIVVAERVAVGGRGLVGNTEGAAVAVSYTHLDVYKRQG